MTGVEEDPGTPLLLDGDEHGAETPSVFVFPSVDKRRKTDGGRREVRLDIPLSSLLSVPTPGGLPAAPSPSPIYPTSTPLIRINIPGEYKIIINLRMF